MSPKTKAPTEKGNVAHSFEATVSFSTRTTIGPASKFIEEEEKLNFRNNNDNKNDDNISNNDSYYHNNYNNTNNE